MSLSPQVCDGKFTFQPLVSGTPVKEPSATPSIKNPLTLMQKTAKLREIPSRTDEPNFSE